MRTPYGRRGRLRSATLLATIALSGCGGGPAAGSSGAARPSAVLADSARPDTPTQPAPSASPSPAPHTAPEGEPSRPPVAEGTGRLLVAAGTGEVVGSGRPRRYLVEVEEGIVEDPAVFAAAVERALGDPRSWAAEGGLALQRVSQEPVDFRVTLAGPATTDRYCRPLRTNGRFSCFMRGRSMVNSWRWRHGARDYGEDLAAYRLYVVNHEVGHALGHGHRSCPGEGDLAPVMMQQTKGLGGCRPNPWPFPGES